MAIAAVWVISPIDLIPEFLPVIGPLDDVVVAALALRSRPDGYHAEVIEEALAGRSKTPRPPAWLSSVTAYGLATHPGRRAA